VSRLAPICALLAAATLGAACGERTEPTGPLPQPYPVSVRGAGDRPTVLKAPPNRIVAVDPGAADLLVALGVGDRLVGVPEGVEGAGNADEVARSTGQLDVDAIVKLDPDLIVATPSTDELDLARAARKSRAAVYVEPANSILNVEQATIDLGFLVGEAPKGRQLVGKIEQRVAAVEDRLADVEPVSVFIDTGFFITVPDRSLLGDLVAKAKGKNAAGPNPGPGPFPLGDLSRLNPDVYLATSDSNVTLAGLKASSATRGLTAVRKKRVRVVPQALVERAGPRIAEGLEAVARALHPDAFR
jgi:iron complex transport system substrate-binding protein